jgi:NAD(P)H-hydrate epimerase
MCRGVERVEDFSDWLAAADAVVLGPGLGGSDWGRNLAAAVLHSDAALVVDADGLNHLAQRPQKRERWAITPHPGEAARLLSQSSADVQAARDEAAALLARRYGAVTVLKGACSLIAEVDDESDSVSIAVVDYGNPGMASGGMGDVLSGVIGALVAQFGFSARAVELAALVHALAGDDAAHAGERGMIASDLLPHIRRRVNPA